MTTIADAPPDTQAPKTVKGSPLLLRTRKEVREYLAAHLTPVSHGPKGQPIYAHEDLQKLNVILYPDA